MRCFNFVLMRGGTSKAVFFHLRDMPRDRNKWTEFLLDVMGSPDARQIDGMGGANSLTSKVAIISRSERGDADVDYTFAQVSLAGGLVDFKGNCGNISSAVGPYAVGEGLVSVARDAEKATVRVFNTNTNKVIDSEIVVANGCFNEKGDAAIPGVPGTASPVYLSFNDPGGAVTGKILPTGNATDIIETSRGKIRISIVDSANPLVFMRAADVGVKGTELPGEFNARNIDFIEEVRAAAAELCGFAVKEEATLRSPAVPKSTVIAAPAAYTAIDGTICKENDMDIVVRMMSMQRPHEALAITGAICTTTAAALKGTLVHELTGDRLIDGQLRIAHPGGVMRTIMKNEKGKLSSVKVLRTARMLAKGVLFTKNDY